MPTLRPKYIPYSYMDPLGKKLYLHVVLGSTVPLGKPKTCDQGLCGEVAG